MTKEAELGIKASRHQMTFAGRRSDIDRDTLLAVARSADVRRAPRILDQVTEAVAAWRHFADQADVPVPSRDHIASEHHLPLA